MIYLFIATLVMTAIIVSVYMKKINYNEIKYDEELSPIIEKLDDNIKVTEEILKKLNNNHTKVIINKDEKSKLSYYNHKKDTIVMQQCEKKEYARIVNIAHECVHTTQKRKFLNMNFVFSNIQLLYFLMLIVLRFFDISSNIIEVLLFIQILIVLMTFFVKVVIESDACYRSVTVAEEYLKDKIQENKLKKYVSKLNENVVKTVPLYYCSMLSQGLLMVIIARIIYII